MQFFPYAEIKVGNKQKVISLLTSQEGISKEEQIGLSLADLEYKVISTLEKINKPLQKIGIVTHHQELPPIFLKGFLDVAAANYELSPVFPINKKSYQRNDLENLKKFDALVFAKPITPFEEEEKIVLDQYIIGGGKTLWFLEKVDAEMDSLARSQQIIAFERDQNLTDFFFSYGIRIKPLLAMAQNAQPIQIATGQTAGNANFTTFNWPYFPLAFPNPNHPVSKGISPVSTNFANPIDTLGPYKKTVLLQTQGLTSVQKPMSSISLSGIDQLSYEKYTPTPHILGVLVEGKFSSAYKDRNLSESFQGFEGTAKEKNKIMVFSDGDIIKNQVQKGEPLPVGFDKWTSVTYGNAALLNNALDYMLWDENLTSLRGKDFTVLPLNRAKISQYKQGVRLVLLLVPIAILGLIYIFFKKIRAKKMNLYKVQSS
ncbi:MAG: gliding motility-associated ABC transporter substrate-binding protein GldG [Flavobacteriaceae bacterium]|nr:MAG: gliding motility-associated ABC transporter substrate-binding protein GldG [Flavobacteriaceae bacterium]